MFGNKPTPTPAQVGAAATKSIDHALGATRQVANDAIDGLGDAVHQLRDDSVPTIDRLGDRAQALARQGLEVVRDQTQHLKERAQRTSDDTVGYIRDEPVKAVLIAAATGAVLMALAGLLMRTQRGR
jgi:ElaB/YqjD/DUF883 family membrane-anchored ribosome-binding protein